MIGRRVATVSEIEQPGDYCGPIMYGTELSCLFMPLAGRALNEAGRRALARVSFPPHTYRECSDGSLEIRASIGIYDDTGQAHSWHGYLDEGNVWRVC